MSKWKVDVDEKCARCRSEKETPLHLWTNCPALTYDRWAHAMMDAEADPYRAYLHFFNKRDLLNCN